MQQADAEKKVSSLHSLDCFEVCIAVVHCLMRPRCSFPICYCFTSLSVGFASTVVATVALHAKSKTSENWLKSGGEGSAHRAAPKVCFQRPEADSRFIIFGRSISKGLLSLNLDFNWCDESADEIKTRLQAKINSFTQSGRLCTCKRCCSARRRWSRNVHECRNVHDPFFS